MDFDINDFQLPDGRIAHVIGRADVTFGEGASYFDDNRVQIEDLEVESAVIEHDDGTEEWIELSLTGEIEERLCAAIYRELEGAA